MGLPLAIGFGGTLLSLFVGKQVHKTFGIIFSLCAFYHMLQHHKQIVRIPYMKSSQNSHKGRQSMNLLQMVGIPTSKIELILRSVDKANYIPGRIRVYSKRLRGNEQLKTEIERALAKYPELDNYAINLVSGSLLIEYQPESIKFNQELCNIEQYIKKISKK